MHTLLQTIPEFWWLTDQVNTLMLLCMFLGYNISFTRTDWCLFYSSMPSQQVIPNAWAHSPNYLEQDDKSTVRRGCLCAKFKRTTEWLPHTDYRGPEDVSRDLLGPDLRNYGPSLFCFAFWIYSHFLFLHSEKRIMSLIVSFKIRIWSLVKKTEYLSKNGVDQFVPMLPSVTTILFKWFCSLLGGQNFNIFMCISKTEVNISS